MRQRRQSCYGLTAVAFVAGLMVSYFCTSGFIIAMLTIAVLILGVLCKY